MALLPFDPLLSGMPGRAGGPHGVRTPPPQNQCPAQKPDPSAFVPQKATSMPSCAASAPLV